MRDLTVRYGAVQALSQVSFDVERGKIVSLIGSNGAGKTTLLKAISGLVQPASGGVFYSGEALAGLRPDQIVRKRIVQASEGRGIFLNLTVDENLDLGAWSVAATGGARRRGDDHDRALQFFPELRALGRQNAGTLSGGQQQMLAIARALLARPELLLLDEPSLGLAPQVIARIFEVIREINRQGVTILLVEQNALQALQLAHRGIVLETGRLTASGPAGELLGSDRVRQAYLGG